MKRGFYTGLIIILIIYTLVYLLFYEAPYHSEIPRRIRHLIKFSTLITVYLIGSYHLRLNNIKWMYIIWHFIHITGIGIITLFGLYDLLVSPTPIYIRTFLLTINEFLISPVLFVGMGILYKKLSITNI